MNKPHINVTPLIDVLLVLLVVFMVVAPLKPSTFKAKIPAERNENAPADPRTLIVIVGSDLSLTLNSEHGLGTTDDTQPLITRLTSLFADRLTNGAIAQYPADADRPFNDNIERTVFIKGPSTVAYGRVARVVDAVKLAGAYPIGLQIDGLE